jgi:hypothetical protein
MADVSIWGVSYTLVRAMCPGLSSTDAPQATIEDCIKRAYSFIQSHVPYKYRQLLTHVPGEYFSRCTSGQKTFTLGLSKASSTGLLVWINPYVSKAQLKRADALDTTQWSLTLQVLTLTTGVSEDDRVVVEYDHDGTGLVPSSDTSDRTLYDMLIKRSAYELGALKYQEVGGGELPAYVTTYQTEVDGWLEQVQQGVAGIPMLDDIVLYEDWEGPSRGIYTIGLVSG